MAPLSTGLSDFRQSAQGGSERECKQILTRCVPGVMTSLLMSYSPIIISHRLFPCRYSNSRDVVESASPSSRPAARAPRRACSHANRLQALAPWTMVSNRFLGIYDEFPYLKEAFKARSGRESGLKVCAGDEMPKIATFVIDNNPQIQYFPVFQSF